MRSAGPDAARDARGARARPRVRGGGPGRDRFDRGPCDAAAVVRRRDRPPHRCGVGGGAPALRPPSPASRERREARRGSDPHRRIAGDRRGLHGRARDGLAGRELRLGLVLPVLGGWARDRRRRPCPRAHGAVGSCAGSDREQGGAERLRRRREPPDRGGAAGPDAGARRALGRRCCGRASGLRTRARHARRRGRVDRRRRDGTPVAPRAARALQRPRRLQGGELRPARGVRRAPARAARRPGSGRPARHGPRGVHVRGRSADPSRAGPHRLRRARRPGTARPEPVAEPIPQARQGRGDRRGGGRGLGGHPHRRGRLARPPARDGRCRIPAQPGGDRPHGVVRPPAPGRASAGAHLHDHPCDAGGSVSRLGGRPPGRLRSTVRARPGGDRGHRKRRRAPCRDAGAACPGDPRVVPGRRIAGGGVRIFEPIPDDSSPPTSARAGCSTTPRCRARWWPARPPTW